ncbi:MAG: aminotransferase class III-fold pyridoxal phosphate-dependent enzyme [Rickettsiaceae bacterium]
MSDILKHSNKFSIIDDFNIKQMDAAYVAHPWSAIDKSFDLIFSSGSGYVVNDIDGNSYIDAASLNLTCGYQHKKIIDAVSKQLVQFPGTDISLASHDLLGTLAKALSDLLPKNLTRTMFVNSGSEGIEAAIFIASSYWNNLNKSKYRIISFAQGYHGSTYLSRGLTKLPRIAHPIEGSMKIDIVNLPEHYNKLEESDFLNALINNFKSAFDRDKTSPIAVIVEPFLNVGGAIKLPSGFLTELRKLCDHYNTLMIVDEVFTGYGRTGRMFAFEHEKVVPDIIVSSKGLAGGYAPVAVVNFKEEIYKSFINDSIMKGIRYGHTTSGHALACAAALATLEVLTEENLIQNSKRQGDKLLKRFSSFKGKGVVRDVRGFGLIFVLEMDSSTSADRFKISCKKMGMLVRQNGKSIMITPPLSIDDNGIDKITNILTTVLTEESFV